MRRGGWLGAAGVIALLGAGIAAAASSTAGEVPRGVTVAGADLGGLTVEEAERRLATLTPGNASPISLVADSEVLSLDPEVAGLAVDAAATARAAADAGPLDRLLAQVRVGREVDPVLDVDAALLDAELTRLAAGFDRPPREGSVVFEGLDPVPTAPLAGKALDIDGAAEAVTGQWPLSIRVEVPTDERAVRTTDDDVERAVREMAEPAVAAPVVLATERGELEVSPAAIAAATRVEVDDGALELLVDGAVLLAQTADLRGAVEQPALDATFDTSSGTPVVVPSQSGQALAVDDVSEAVRSVLTGPAPRRADVALTLLAPRVSTEAAAGLGVVEKISSYTSDFPCCAPRVTNIQRIAEIVDGYVLLPGEGFDLNAVVGPRDTARGFVPAPQILRGEFVDDVGGGVSQFATALFNASFFAALEDVTHTPHSYYISRYPPGREATISFPEPALVFRNDSPQGVLIRATSTGTSVTVAMWGTKRFDVDARQGPRTRVTTAETRYLDRPDCQPGNGGEGFDITVTRVFSAGGAEVRREEFDTRYLAQPRFVCGPAP